MPNVGPTELIIILVIVLLVFGSTRLPKLARSVGEASREFRKGVSEGNKVDEPKPRSEEQVSMSRAELDALLAERERQAGREQAPPV